MTRYFHTTNASRQYKAGALKFVFELTENFGSTWRGVLAVADEAAANTLAGAGIPQISEITQEEYEAQKKTAQPLGSSRSIPSRPPQLPSPAPLGAVAVVEASTTVLRSPKPAPAPATPATVDLNTRQVDIVDELK